MSNMDYQIELYQGPEKKYFGTMPIMPLFKESLQRQLGINLSGVLVRVSMLNVPEDILLPGSPIVENLIPEFGYAYIMVVMDNRVIYRHPHPLSDILTQALQTKLAAAHPDITYWYFRIDLPEIPRESKMRATPLVEGLVPVRPFAADEKPAFSIRRIAEEEPPSKTLGDFGITMEERFKTAKVKVLLAPELEQDLIATRPLSDRVEEGGFLVGNIYKECDGVDTYIMHIKSAPFAAYTGASFFHFTYTGDSFAKIKRTLREEHPGERLLGWFHTHLFPATDTLGLTFIDVDLHFGTFTIPWQVAGLINLDFYENRRVLRFYVRENNRMILCPWKKMKLGS